LPVEGRAANFPAAQKQWFIAMIPRRGDAASRRTAAARTQSERSKSKAIRGAGSADKLAALERERDALRHELERSEARIEALEKTQAQVRDRLAWALDSLQNIIQGKG
jgi:predicted RNase H-like nuclease (RuvC/YqgF family)